MLFSLRPWYDIPIMKRIRIKKRYIIITFIVVAALVLFFVLRKNSSSDYTEYTVVRTNISDELLLAGTIDAIQRVNLGFASSGRVLKNNVQVGDAVKKGDVLAEISQNRLLSDLMQAQAQYTVARVDADTDIFDTTDSYEKILAEQNTNVEGLYQQYLSGDLQAYSTDGTSRNIQPPLISGTYTGNQEGQYYIDMYGSSSSSGYSFKLSGLDTGTYGAEVYQPGLLGDQGLYIQFDASSSYGNMDWVIPVPNTRSSTYLARKTAYENALRTRDAMLAKAENDINRITSTSLAGMSKADALKNQARSQVGAVSAQLNDGKIIAPFDGIIAKNNIELGEIVNAFDAQIVLFTDLEKKLIVNVPEIYINKIELGDAVDVRLDAYSDILFNGTIDFIDFIDTNVDGVPVYQIDIQLINEDERVRVGMNAKASIISQKIENTLAIPAHYIMKRDTGDSFVLVYSENSETPLEQNVTVGFQGNEGLVEITSGLAEGDIILLKNE